MGHTRIAGHRVQITDGVLEQHRAEMEEKKMGEILSINERWYPVGGSSGMRREPVTAVLVAGAVGDYAVYVGCGSREHAQDIARHGDKISFMEACCHFPIGLQEEKYRR